MKQLREVVNFPGHEGFKQHLGDHHPRTVVKEMRRHPKGSLHHISDAASFHVISCTEVHTRLLGIQSHLTHKEKHLTLQLRESKENTCLEKESPGYLLVAGLPVIGPQE